VKKVIIYGVFSIYLRRNIENFLDEDYEIIGYSDSFEKRDGVDGKNFIPPEQLRNSGADFIVLALETEKARKQVREFLLELGIQARQIIDPFVFFQPTMIYKYFDIVQYINENSGDYESVMLGLSYSYRGIIEENLKEKVFNFSVPSADLYYNSLVFRYSLEHNLIRNVKRVYLFVPYYYFDYDLSMSLRPVMMGMMMTYHQLNDWHNSGKIVETNEYAVMGHMFAKKIMKFYNVRRKSIKTNVRKFKDENLEVGLKRFGKHFEDTVEENKKVLREFLDYLKERNIELDIIVPPFYLKEIPYEYEENIKQMKQYFYQRIQNLQKEYTFGFYDYLNIYQDRKELFADHIHLNYDGAQEFTSFISNEFEKKN